MQFAMARLFAGLDTVATHSGVRNGCSFPSTITKLITNRIVSGKKVAEILTVKLTLRYSAISFRFVYIILINVFV